MNFDLDDPRVLFAAEVLDEPAVFYARLRATAPVWELPGSRTFLVTTAALVNEAVGRPEDFSSNMRSLLFTGDDGKPAILDMSGAGDGAQVLATADPPNHLGHRKLLQPLFNPGAVDRLSGFVESLADELIGPLVASGRGDLMAQVAEPLPARVICRMVGIPDDDVAMLTPLVLQVNDLLAGVIDAVAMAQSSEAALKVLMYLDELLGRWRTSDDGTTVCDVLLRARDAGELGNEAVQGMLHQLLSAGTETTTSLIGRTVLQLARDRDLQQKVREHLDLVPALLEEMLRFDGPFRFHYRAAVRDAELGGVHIPAGSRVLLMWAAANLDDAFVERPDEFDITRANVRSHFGFGRGAHFCIGAPLARLEGRIAIESLLRRTSSFELDPSGDAPAYRPSIAFHRLARLPLLARPASQRTA